jgi:hypothetical protein
MEAAFEIAYSTPFNACAGEKENKVPEGREF